jgi:hypothetical protein
MNKYQEILNLFVSEDKMRDWMLTPFVVGNKVIATNGWALVAFDKSKIDCSSLRILDKSKLNGTYPLEENINSHNTVDFLKECFLKVPLVDDYCNECKGSGEVTFIYEDSKLKDHKIDGECPICDGFGVCEQEIENPNGKKVPDIDAKCVIGNCLFFTNKVELIIKVADLLKEKYYSHINQTLESRANLFRVGEVEILLMPIMSNGNFHDDGVCFNIA